MKAQDELDILRSKTNTALVIDGESLQCCIDNYKDQFIEMAVRLPVVVACRCSPTQKAEITKLIKDFTGRRVCAIGDGGNDVSMIQQADVGVGIVGKEGKQASLAADFSVTQFSFLTRLLLWHGRNSCKDFFGVLLILLPSHIFHQIWTLSLMPTCHFHFNFRRQENCQIESVCYS